MQPMNRAQRRAAKARGELPRPLVAHPSGPRSLADAPPGALAGPQRICLSMIVRNESHVIRRALASVRPFIHSWAVCDTGSTDGTQAVIRDFMRDIPGRLIERPWVADFAASRNQALDLARETGAEFALFMDADDTIEPADPGAPLQVLGAIRADRVIIPGIYGDAPTSSRYHLARLADARWVGAVHERLLIGGLDSQSIGVLSAYRMRVRHDGAASLQLGEAGKVALYKSLLLAEVERSPEDPCAWEYIASAYFAEMDWPAAEHAADRVLALASAEASALCYFALCIRGRARIHQGASVAAVLADFEQARALSPKRAEAPRYLAAALQLRGEDPARAAQLNAEADAMEMPLGAHRPDPRAYARAPAPTAPTTDGRLASSCPRPALTAGALAALEANPGGIPRSVLAALAARARGAGV